MLLSKALALLPLIALLFSMGFFMLASLPLLILKHDTPVDARFVRGLFNLYYIVVMTIAAIGAIGCTFTGQAGVAVAMGSLAVFVFGVRRWMIAQMDTLRGAIGNGDSTAVQGFRQLHIAGMVLNVIQLGTVAWGMTRLAT